MCRFKEVQSAVGEEDIEEYRRKRLKVVDPMAKCLGMDEQVFVGSRVPEK